jgi:cytochrome bd-type quinol oxidase subunit 2
MVAYGTQQDKYHEQLMDKIMESHSQELFQNIILIFSWIRLCILLFAIYYNYDLFHMVQIAQLLTQLLMKNNYPTCR